MRSLTWDLFCRVIDNYGDVGVCWRLACDLASRGEHVRLWLDNVSPLEWMAPTGHARVDVIAWTTEPPSIAPGDVVIEAFGCDPPAEFVARMAAAAKAPIWINLEYLSAENYVERSHRLPSPQMSGPGTGLIKWFFYPGFTAATGGLMRETDLLGRQGRFDADAWLASHGLQRDHGERVISLFCYANAALPDLLDALSRAPTLLLAAAGEASAQVLDILGPQLNHGQMRAHLMPRLTQLDYDAMLWSSDVNCVRGEDSLVRAIWAGRPFVWQIYPQADGAHLAKLEAFDDMYLAGADAGLGSQVRGLWRRWNSDPRCDSAGISLPSMQDWRELAMRRREILLAQEDLVSALVRFIAEQS